jgi:DNA mismatch endonuclease, patch repair protein
MADTRTKEQRRRIMKSVGTRNTGPELVVRRLLHRLGFRFRLHKRELPGSPDIVLRKWKTAVFVHGCYWHGHGCQKGRLPKSRLDYWGPKIEANRARDRAVEKRLKDLGWNVVTVWQCETKDERTIAERLPCEIMGTRQEHDRRPAPESVH